MGSPIQVNEMHHKWDFTVRKKVVNFSYEDSFDNKLTKLTDIASLSLYDTVDVKVKVVQKTEERQHLL